jgi:hypothetical protein
MLWTVLKNVPFSIALTFVPNGRANTAWETWELNYKSPPPLKMWCLSVRFSCLSLFTCYEEIIYDLRFHCFRCLNLYISKVIKSLMTLTLFWVIIQMLLDPQYKASVLKILRWTFFTAVQYRLIVLFPPSHKQVFNKQGSIAHIYLMPIF